MSDIVTPNADAAAAPVLLSILIAPHPSLRARARAVTTADLDRIRDLLPRFYATMYDAPGIGLAAPQVGIGLRFAVVDVAENDAPNPITLINPEIVKVSEDWVAREEGCLSLPDQYAEISRPDRVTVRYQDLEGKTHQLEAEGLLATCLQHELDHLDGVLFVDHLSPLKRNMIMRKLAKEQKQKGGRS